MDDEQNIEQKKKTAGKKNRWKIGSALNDCCKAMLAAEYQDILLNLSSYYLYNKTVTVSQMIIPTIRHLYNWIRRSIAMHCSNHTIFINQLDTVF